MVNEKKVVRPISTIAREIFANWPSVNYAAVPYLQAMFSLDSVDDKYYIDDARDIVLRFLCNAQSFRGQKARELKAELKSIVGVK